MLALVALVCVVGKADAQGRPDFLWLAAGHGSAVDSVAFSPDGQTLASGSDDRTIKLWNAQTGALRRTLTGHASQVYSVAFSPDGLTIASGSLDNTIKLWNAQTGALRRTLTGHTGPVYSVAFSPDGQTIASGSLDDTIKLWNVQTGALLRTLTGHTSYVFSVAFSPDGQALASGSYWEIKLWNAQTGALVRTLTGHLNMILSVAFSPDGQTLGSGSWDNTIKLWNVQTGALLRSLAGHTNGVNSVAFSPEGQTLASGSSDGTVRIWDSNSGSQLKVYDQETGPSTTSVAYSPDGSRIALGRSDATLGLFASPYQDPNMLADSARDFQTGSQGFLGWRYGYYPGPPFTPNTFAPFPRIRDQFWDISDSYWTTIGRTLMHGNGSAAGRTPVVHHAVRRWTSDYAGRAYIAIRLDRLDYRGNGTLFRVLAQNGSLIEQRFVAPNDENGEELFLPLTLKLGESLDFALDPVNGDETFDSTAVRIEIYAGRRINGQLSVEDRESLPNGTPVSVQVVQPGYSEEVDQVSLDAQGRFSFDCSAPPGPTTLYLKCGTGLRKAVAIQLGRGPTHGLTVQLVNGDIDGDNAVTVFDYDVLSTAFDTSAGDGKWDARADLDGDGTVSVFDYDILSRNFDQVGD